MTPAEIKRLRKRLGLSQADFAYAAGISVRTLQGWEAGRKKPDGPAAAYLRHLDKCWLKPPVARMAKRLGG